ncbi:hypothetical protein [Actinoplanes derwentensis]|uniref:Excalibur calcium-binding domain-containing protein n=1 Tax=Actinoplanes derwentensis TaxID=113562 RepID=A0A1H2CHJ6_9ACTN|nr:hypothetical protein [Actinoplanes derwentensis]GID88726.1 hypothetical protein Ade03nite_76500 [Actinoplanes derwentensis]SDT69737.1 hypothetical protein SAMN04489716_5820 [Actinoplanes derwentensis]
MRHPGVPVVTVLAIIVSTLLAVALAALFRATGQEQSAVPPAPRPTDSTWPLVAPAAATAPVAVPAGATPRPTTTTTTTAPVTTAPHTTPEPFVQTFTGRPAASPLPRLPSPTARLSMPVNVDGCDRSYGTRTQCVPWRFPPGVTDGCTWLRERSFLDAPLTARAPDRHHLDPDTNGLACDN